MNSPRPEPTVPEPDRQEKAAPSGWPPAPGRSTPEAPPPLPRQTKADASAKPATIPVSPDDPETPPAIPAIPANPDTAETPSEPALPARPAFPLAGGEGERRRPKLPVRPEPDFNFGPKKGAGQLRDQFFGPGAGRTRRPENGRLFGLAVLLLVLLVGAGLVWLKVTGRLGGRPKPPVDPVAVVPPAPPPGLPDPVVPPVEIPPPEPAPLAPETAGTDNLPPEAVAAEPLTLDEASRQIAELGREVSDHPLWLRLLGQSAILERAVSAMDFLAAGERPLPALDFLKSPQPFAADRSSGSLRQSKASLNRYTPLCRMFAALPPDKLAALYRKLEPALQQACENLGYRDQTVRSLLTRACTTILSCPIMEQDEELVATGKPGLFRWARPELEGLGKAEKLFLRLGPQNSAMVRQHVEKTALELQLFSE